MIRDIQRFKDLIKLRCGLMFEGSGEGNLAGALAKRIAATKAADETRYFAMLVGHDDEFQHLVTLLTINETYFFREADQLRLLTDRLVPRLLAERGGDLPIRILSAGCSTGEEPYSIAIALLEKYGESMPRLVSIAAGDIDHQALAKARQAKYSAFSFRGLPADLQQRYFSPANGQHFQLCEQVRGLVQFHRLNVLSQTPVAGLQDLDIVFFRNVSIYFDAPTRKAIQQNLGALMRETGTLVVGIAETLANDLGVFNPVEEDGLFYFTKGRAPAAPVPVPRAEPRIRPAALAKPDTPVRKRAPRAPAAVAAPAPDLAGIRGLVAEKRYADAQTELRALLLQSPDSKDAIVLNAYVHLQTRDFAAAEAEAKRVLELDAWSTEACVVLGFAAKHGGDLDAAIRWFKQAIYGRHECWVAHYYLADCYRATNAPDLAARAFRVALQHLSGQPDPNGGLALPLGLPVAEMRFLCERHAAPAPARSTGRR